ncbi:thioredoxin family protein [Candidatus Chlamydia sanziniae]|uniref:Disulfide bond isomerase n=1 Tax=Candidatus Chlamydia sanziniae TaxID=1806891 RepID=A0A1A9HXS6_9CHLA|nr:thioredoxin family protein [Candidatus Chlamydia sanziniae]ANH78726.1 putative disulfide bond isomerase [Candidatus Chlamydia sanziniae]
MILLQNIKRCSLKQLKILTTLLLGISSPVLEASIQDTSCKLVWHLNYQEALQKSKESELPLLIFFSGSDWNGACMKIRKEVLDSQDFIKKVAGKFICVKVDYLKHTPQAESIRQQNACLKSQFKIDELPCMVLLSPEEQEIYRLGSFGNETGTNLGDSLCHIVDSDSLLRRAFPIMTSLSMAELQLHYRLAEELSRKDFLTQALEFGVRSDDYFFLSEKFRLLVENGKMDSEECQRIKKRLLSKDSKNEKQTHFTVALIEFQELAKRSREGVRQEASQVIAPLETYLSQFGQQDKDNLWRVEMMIAQFYLDSDQWHHALQHAEVAFDAAPAEIRSHISRSLEYIRHQS